MAEAWLPNLSDLQLASPSERDAWLSAHPLRGFLQDLAVGEIRRCALDRLGPPEPGAPYRMIFRWQSGPMSVNVRMPLGIHFTGLRFARPEDGDPRRYLIHFDTDQGTVTTNPQEFSAAMAMRAPAAQVAEEVLMAEFQSLENAFKIHTPPPAMAAFRSRHLGEVKPDTWGRSEANLTIASLSSSPMDVFIEHLGAEDAEAIDATFDRFLNGLERRIAEATPAVVRNMQEFCEAVYRGVNDPPITGPGRDEPFEEMLALTDPARIWDYVRFHTILLTRAGTPPNPPEPQRIAEGPIYVTLTGECEWEFEHGLGIVWRGGETLSAVGSSDVRVTDGL